MRRVLPLIALLPTVVCAGYIDTLPTSHPVYKAAAQVAAQGCTIGGADWTALVIAHGGREGDAVWELSQMMQRGEVLIDTPRQTMTLRGVFGC